MIAWHLALHKAKVIVGFLLELGFIFVGVTSWIINLEKPNSNYSLNICSLGGVLFLGQSRYTSIHIAPNEQDPN
jgi:membrane protein insertase Oxa1/YidC/SpoIIIJ